MKKIFELKNVKKIFSNKRGLQNIDLDIFAKDKICFVGENGAGKTTLLKLITKSTAARKGKVIYDKAAFKNMKISYLFQENDFPMNLSVRKILKIIKWNEKDSDFYQSLYMELDLENILNNKLFQLSGGEKQKLMLFQTLVSKPDVLILDEYSNHIDMPTFKKMQKIILDYVENNNVTLLMSSHKKKEMENSCSKVIILKEGQIIKNFENEKKFSLKEINTIMKFNKDEDFK